MNPLDKVFRGYYGSGVEKSTKGEPNIKVNHEQKFAITPSGNFRLGPAVTWREN